MFTDVLGREIKVNDKIVWFQNECQSGVRPNCSVVKKINKRSIGAVELDNDWVQTIPLPRKKSWSSEPAPTKFDRVIKVEDFGEYENPKP